MVKAMATVLLLLAIAIFMAYSVLEFYRSKSEKGLTVEEEETQRHRLAAVMDQWKRVD
jgi:Na+-transporting methylmalonyl-CoA/oxaloacetate decarboxylase gamma subunit